MKTLSDLLERARTCFKKKETTNQNECYLVTGPIKYCMFMGAIDHMRMTGIRGSGGAGWRNPRRFLGLEAAVFLLFSLEYWKSTSPLSSTSILCSKALQWLEICVRTFQTTWLCKQPSIDHVMPIYGEKITAKPRPLLAAVTRCSSVAITVRCLHNVFPSCVY